MRSQLHLLFAPYDRRRRLLATVIVMAAALVALSVLALPPRADAAVTLLSQGRPVSASSIENAGTPAANAVDGNTGTRWSSAFSDPQWIQVDLGASAAVSQVVLRWEATAHATVETCPLSKTPEITLEVTGP